MELLMSSHKVYNDHRLFSEVNHDHDDDQETIKHKKRVRHLLEDRLDRKRLKEELDDELEGEFDWKDLDY